MKIINTLKNIGRKLVKLVIVCLVIGAITVAANWIYSMASRIPQNYVVRSDTRGHYACVKEFTAPDDAKDAFFCRWGAVFHANMEDKYFTYGPWIREGTNAPDVTPVKK